MTAKKGGVDFTTRLLFGGKEKELMGALDCFGCLAIALAKGVGI